MLDILLTTILKRPYILVFLFFYLLIAGRLMGWRWTILFLFCGYTIAFLSEYLSINYGVPYGWYFYKYENLEGEWLNHGVPVWDSISYVFMNFAGLAMAQLRNGSCPTGTTFFALPFRDLLLSALLVTLLDVVVDPVAHRGAQWFLGDIYYYPNPGFYFDVTLANFAGWYVTSLLICGMGMMMDRGIRPKLPNNFWQMATIGLYYGIMAFGIAIAVYLQEWGIVLCDVGWLGATVLIVFGRPMKNRPPLCGKTGKIARIFNERL